MLIRFSDLPRVRESHRNETIVLAGGTFDLFHEGHVDALKQLRRFGTVVVVAVSSDKRVRQRKGPLRPILSQRERAILVDAVRYVDYTLVAPLPSRGQEVPTVQIIRSLQPNLFVTADARWRRYRGFIPRLGTDMRVVRRGKVNSTSRIIAKIVRRYCSDADARGGFNAVPGLTRQH